MVTSVLAQAILSQDAPDLVGAFKEGQQEVRAEKTKELAGEALAGGGIDPLLFELNPEVAFALGEQINARNSRDISDFLRDAQIVKAKLDSGDIQGSLQFTEQRERAIRNRGGDPSQTSRFKQTLTENPEQARQELAALLGTVEQAKATAGEREFETFTKGLTPEETQRAKRIRLGLEARAATSPEELAQRERLKLEAQRDIKPEIKGLEEAAKGISSRQQSFIDSGIDAADSTANIRRGIELLSSVKTGGLNAAALKSKQLFGVEGADEGELSANLGIAVLGQLKPIFGAAFTAAEGERLEKISAGFGRNPETNKRLLGQALKIAERSARRAIKAAEAAGDSFTAEEIRQALKFNVSPEKSPTPGGIKFLGFE
jgi:hypothetical protein